MGATLASMTASMKIDKDMHGTADMKRLALWLTIAAALLAGLVAAWTFMMRPGAPVGDPATYDGALPAPEPVADFAAYEDERHEPVPTELPSGDPGTYEELEPIADPGEQEN
jgi:hypothetical protein